MSSATKWFAPAERSRRRKEKAKRRQAASLYATRMAALVAGSSNDHFTMLEIPARGFAPMALWIADTEGRFDSMIAVRPGSASDQGSPFKVKAHVEPPDSVRIPYASSIFVGDYIAFGSQDNIIRRVVGVDRITDEFIRNIPCRGPCGEQWSAILKAKRHLRLKWTIDHGREDHDTFDSVNIAPVVILFTTANPHCDLDLEEEVRAVELELTAAEYRDHIRIEKVVAARPKDLIRVVSNHSPAVVHFSGHGDKRGIVLRSERGDSIDVTSRDLRSFFSQRNVELVVLNSCYSDSQARLIANEVRAVVGTTDEVDDEDARLFSAAFYRTLGDGHTVSTAIKNGRDNVNMSGGADVFKSLGDTDFRLVEPAQQN